MYNEFKVKEVRTELDKNNKLRRVLLVLDNQEELKKLINISNPLLKSYEEKIRK